MSFPVDILADVSHEELERSSQMYIKKLLYSNPDYPEQLRITASTQVPIQSSSVGLIPLYGSSDKHKVLALFPPEDAITAVAFYLLDQWWTLEDIMKTSDAARDGVVKVETVGERIVLYVLNRWIYRATEMNTDERLFLCHMEKDYAKILWKNGEAVGFYSVKPSGVLFDSTSTRTYQLPVMDSLFVRKCHRGHGFGLHLLDDYVHSFKEECLGIKYPLSIAMCKVCEKYLSKYPGYTDVLWEVERTGTPIQRTNIARKIQAMDLRAVTKTLLFAEESLVAAEGAAEDVVMEAMTTQIDEPDSMECSVQITEEVTALKTARDEAPVVGRSRSGGSDRTKTREKTTEDKSEKVIRIEDIEAETPKTNQLAEEQRAEAHNVWELDQMWQAEAVLSVDSEEKGECVFDQSLDEATAADARSTDLGSLSTSDLEDAAVTAAAAGEDEAPPGDFETTQNLQKTCFDPQITVEIVASGIEGVEEESQKEKTAVQLVPADILDTYEGVEVLDKTDEGTKVKAFDEDSIESDKSRDIAHMSHAVAGDIKAGKTAVKVQKPAESETPSRRSHRHSKSVESVRRETSRQGSMLVLRGRTIVRTPTPKRQYIRKDHKIRKKLEKELDEFVESAVGKGGEQEVAVENEANKRSGVAVQKFAEEISTGEKQHQEAEQLINEEKTETREETERRDALPDEPVAELSGTKPEEDNKRTEGDELEEEEKAAGRQVQEHSQEEQEAEKMEQEVSVEEPTAGVKESVSNVPSLTEGSEEEKKTEGVAESANVLEVEGDDTRQESGAIPGAAHADEVQEEAYSSAEPAAAAQETDIASQIHKLQNPIVVLVDLKTTCRHLQLKAAEETPAAEEQLEEEQLDVTAAQRVQAGVGSSDVEGQSSGSEHVAATSLDETAEALTVEEKELGEDNSRKEELAKSTSRTKNLKADEGAGTAGEEDQAKTAVPSVEGDVVKDVVAAPDPAENPQTAGSETFADTEKTIPVPENVKGNILSAEVDEATRMDEDEVPVVEKRVLRSGKKKITSTPMPKSTRSKEQEEDKDKEAAENNDEEEPQGKTSTLTQGGVSTSVMPEDKLTKPTEEGNQMQEEESTAAAGSGAFKQGVSIEIMVEKVMAVAEEAISGESTITEHSVSEAFAEGTSVEEEPPPVVETRALRSGAKTVRGPTKYRSRRSTKQQEDTEGEGGAYAEKNTSEEETKARKKEHDDEGRQESASEEAEAQEEEARLTTGQEQDDNREEMATTKEADEETSKDTEKEKAEEEDKIDGGTEAEPAEEPQLEAVEMEEVRTEGEKETTTKRAGVEADTDEVIEEEELDTTSDKHVSDSAGVMSTECQESPEQENEDVDHQVCRSVTVTVDLVDLSNEDHEVQEESAAVECQVVLEKTAADREDQRELMEEVPETSGGEMEVDVPVAEEKRFDEKVAGDVVAIQDAAEGKPSVGLCEEAVTPVKGSETVWTTTEDGEEEPEVHIRVLRSGEKSFTQRQSSKSAHVQLQGEKNNEEEEPVTPEHKEAEMKQRGENVEDEEEHLQERSEAEVEVEEISRVETKDAVEAEQCEVCVEKEEAGHEEDLPSKVSDQDKQEEQDKERGGESAENKEEEAQEETRTSTQGGTSTCVTPGDKSTKPTEGEDQMETEESITAEETVIQEEAREDSGPKKGVTIEIIVEKVTAVAEEALTGENTIVEQSAGVSETVSELEASAEGTSFEEEERPPVVGTRAGRGRKMVRGPTTYRSTRSTKQLIIQEGAGGESAEKNSDDEETRISRIEQKSAVGRGKELHKERDEGPQESASEETEVQEEEARLTTGQEQDDNREETATTEEADEETSKDTEEEKAEEEDKIDGGTEAEPAEEPQLGTVEMEEVRTEGEKETTTNRGGVEADTIEVIEEEEMDTTSAKHISDSAGVTSTECQESPEQENEDVDHQVCRAVTVTVDLVDLSKEDHEVQEESAAVECQVVLEKTAADREEQRELKEQVPETSGGEMEVDVPMAEEKRFDEKVAGDVVAIQDAAEGKQSVGLCEEAVTPVKGSETVWTTTEDEEEEPEVHIRVLRSGKKSFTQRRSSKRAHVQLQGEKNNEEEEPVTPEHKEAEMKQRGENVEDEEEHLQERREAEVLEEISSVETKDAVEAEQCEVCVEKEEAGHEEDLPSKVSDQNKQEEQDKERGGESAENKEEEAQEETRTSTQGGTSTCVTPGDKSTKPTEGEDQMETEESITVEEKVIEEEEASQEVTPENKNKEIRENVVEESGGVSIEIRVEKVTPVAEEAEEPISEENTIMDQSAGVSEVFSELKASAEGSSFDEEEPPPVVQTRARRGGRKTLRGPTKYRSRRSTKQQEDVEAEGGITAKEIDERKETAEEEDKVKGGTEAKPAEEPQLGTVEMEEVASSDGKKKTTKRAGVEIDPDEVIEEEEMDTASAKHVSDSAGVTSTECQENEDVDHQVCRSVTVTVDLVDLSNEDDEVQEESAAVECQVVLEKTAADREDQRELKEQVPETSGGEMEVDVPTAEEKRFDEKVAGDVVAIQDAAEGKQSVGLCEEAVTPVKGSETVWTTTEDEEEEPEVHIRVLRSGKKSFTQRRSTAENKEEEAQEETRTSTQGGTSTCVTPGDKSTKPTEEEDQMETEESITAEETGIQEEAREDSGPKKGVTIEIIVEKVTAVAEEALTGENAIVEQSAGVSETVSELEASAEGTSFEEEERPPVVGTRAGRGRKMVRGPTTYRSTRSTKQLIIQEGAGGESAEKNSDDEETRIPRIEQKSAVGRGKELCVEKEEAGREEDLPSKVSDQNKQEAQDKEQDGEAAESKEEEAQGETSASTQGGTSTCVTPGDKSTKPTEEEDQMETEESITAEEKVIEEEEASQEVAPGNKNKEIRENITEESGGVTVEIIVEKVTAVGEEALTGEAEVDVEEKSTVGTKQDAVEVGRCDIFVEGEEADHAASGNAEDDLLSEEAEGAGQQSASTSATAETAGRESAEETPLPAEEGTPETEAPVIETRVLRSGGKTRQREKASAKQQQKDKQDSAEEEEEIEERRILRKGRKSTPATSRRKSKRGRTQHQTAEEDSESPPDEKTTGDEDVLELEKEQTGQKVEEAASGEKEDDTEPGIEKMERERKTDQEESGFLETSPREQEKTPDGERITQTDEDRVDKRDENHKSASEAEGTKELEKSNQEPVTEESATVRDVAEDNQSAVSEARGAEEGQAFTGKSAKDDIVESLREQQEANVAETRVLRSGRKTIKAGQASISQQQKDKQDAEAAGHKSSEEGEVIAERRILRKGRKSAPTPSRRKPKRARTQRQEEEEEETGEEEQTVGLDSAEEKDTEEGTNNVLKEEGKTRKMELGKAAEEEERTECMESMTREEEDDSAVVTGEKALTESEERKNSAAAVEESVPEMIAAPSDEVEGTAKSVEGAPVADVELNSVAAEETQVDDASVEQAQAANSGRYRREEDQVEAEMRQEEGKPEQEETIHLAELPGTVQETEESPSSAKEAELLAKDTADEKFDEPADMVTVTETAGKNIESPEEELSERNEGTVLRGRRKTLPVASGTKSKDRSVEVEETEEPEDPKRRSPRRSRRHRSHKEGDELGGETEAANEEGDDKVELNKTKNKDEDEEAKCSADAQTEVMEENAQDYSQTSETGGEDADVLTLELDSDQETETTGIKGDDDQSTSEEEDEPVVIGERVLRRRTVPPVTPQSKRSKGKKAEEASAEDDCEQRSDLAQTRRLRKRKSAEATPTRKSKRHSRH